MAAGDWPAKNDSISGRVATGLGADGDHTTARQFVKFLSRGG